MSGSEEAKDIMDQPATNGNASRIIVFFRPSRSTQNPADGLAENAPTFGAKIHTHYFAKKNHQNVCSFTMDMEPIQALSLYVIFPKSPLSSRAGIPGDDQATTVPSPNIPKVTETNYENTSETSQPCKANMIRKSTVCFAYQQWKPAIASDAQGTFLLGFDPRRRPPRSRRCSFPISLRDSSSSIFPVPMDVAYSQKSNLKI